MGRQQLTSLSGEGQQNPISTCRSTALLGPAFDNPARQLEGSTSCGWLHAVLANHVVPAATQARRTTPHRPSVRQHRRPPCRPNRHRHRRPGQRRSRPTRQISHPRVTPRRPARWSDPWWLSSACPSASSPTTLNASRRHRARPHTPAPPTPRHGRGGPDSSVANASAPS